MNSLLKSCKMDSPMFKPSFYRELVSHDSILRQVTGWRILAGDREAGYKRCRISRRNGSPHFDAEE